MKKKTKNDSCRQFYRVRATIRVPGYQSLALEGTFLPKPDNGATTPQKIKQECLDYIEQNVRWDTLSVPRDTCKITVTYTVLHNDFIVVEGKSRMSTETDQNP